VPIGENFTDFTYVPLPGVNAMVYPNEYQLRQQGYVSNPVMPQQQNNPNFLGNQYLMTEPYLSSPQIAVIALPSGQAQPRTVQGGYIWPPYGPYAFLQGN
jgi:hypothetical protein